MKLVKLLALSAVAGLLATSLPANAQVPSVGLPPMNVPTYHAALSFTPAVTASKDLFTIVGSATKLVRVTRLSCSGTSTAAASIPVLVNKYLTAATTGGTATTPSVIPADSLDAAGTAVVKAYTAAPTSGTGGGPIRAATLQTSVPAGNGATPATWDFTGRIPARLGLLLRGTTQELAVSTNATALSAGTVLNCDVEWTEQ
jgi:hypothetical protein